MFHANLSFFTDKKNNHNALGLIKINTSLPALNTQTFQRAKKHQLQQTKTNFTNPFNPFLMFVTTRH